MKESNNQKTVSVLDFLKPYKKVISFVMLISILWVSGPLQIVDAFTEKIDYSITETNDKFSQIPDYDTTSDIDFNSKEILVDSEVESERTANSKTFKKSDGTFETVIYNKNVHFNNNGVYENIDNRLVLDSKSNNYTNKNNLYKIQFPDYLQESNDINLTYDSYSISWSTRNILSTKANVEESISNKSIKDANTTTQAMTYYEIAKGVDLEYILDSNTIKENIILKNYIKDYSISFEYKTEGLILSQNDQYEWVLVNEEKQVIFKFADFVMIDELGNQSKDITIDIDEISENSFLLTVKPDNVWLEKANYPVKIDPTVVVIAPQNNEQIVKDKFVWGLDGVHDNVAPFIPSEIILKVGNNSSNNHLYRSYIQVNNLSIPDNSFLTYAKLNLIAKATFGQQSGLNVQIKEVDSLIHDFNYIEGINDYSIDKTIDYTSISPYLPDLVTWDVTEILKQAISEDQTQLIMELSLMDEILDSYIEFHSVYSNFYSDGLSPFIIFEYGYGTNEGMKNYWTYQTFSNESAGDLSISDFSGYMTIARQDLFYENELQKIDLTLVYDQSRYNFDNGFGAGWLTNYNIALDSSDINNPKITDASGSISHYYLTPLTPDPNMNIAEYNCYVSDNGSNDFLVKYNYEGTYAWFYTPQTGIRYWFDNQGRLEYITSKTNTSSYQEKVKVLYDSGSSTRISEIQFFTDYSIDNTPTAFNKINFYYDNNLLYRTELSLKQADGSFNPIQKTDYYYVYNSSISQYVLGSAIYYNKYSEQSIFDYIGGAEYNYCSKGLINSLIDDFGLNLTIDFDQEDKISQINYHNNLSPIEEFTFERNSYSTTITNRNGDYKIFSFDIYGHTVQILDNFEYIESFKYLNSTSHPYFSHRISTHTPETLISNSAESFIHSDFESGYTGWNIYNNTIETNSQSNFSQFVGNSSLKIIGMGSQEARAELLIDDMLLLNSLPNEITISGWAKIIDGADKDSIRMELLTLNSGIISESYYLWFDVKNLDWQFNFANININHDFDEIRIRVIYEGYGEVLFDNVKIESNYLTKYYDYDLDNRRLEGIQENSEKYYDYEYDDYNRLINVEERVFNPDGTVIIRTIDSTTYNQNNQLLLDSITRNNITTEYSFNNKGQLIEETIGDEFSNLTLSNSYNSLFGQYLSQETDSNGYTTYYAYNELNGLLESIENDLNHQLDYEYNNKGQLIKVTNPNYCIQGECSSVEYIYDSENRLSSILTSNGISYNLAYDSKDRIDSVGISGLSSPLIDYSYVTDDIYQTNLIETMTYGNDDIFKYIYNDQDLVEFVQIKESVGEYKNKFYYEYDQSGRITKVDTYKNNIVILTENYFYNLGLATLFRTIFI